MFAVIALVISLIWIARIAYRDGRRQLDEVRSTRDYSSFIGYSFRLNLKILALAVPLVGVGMLLDWLFGTQLSNYFQP